MGAAGRSLTCRLRGKMKRERTASLTAVAVGDCVEVTPLPGDEGAIEAILPRRTQLARSDARNPRRRQVIIANADVLVAVHAAADPALNFVNVDRCLVLGMSGGLTPALVVNKLDLAGPDLEAALEPYRKIGVEVLVTSARRGDGVADLKKFLGGRTSVFIGPSGVGKSTLLNAINPAFGLKTRETSRRTGEGRHTTSWVELLEVEGGLVADTPGLEFFTLWGVTQRNLQDYYPEMAPLAGKCGFTDCVHLSEPRCAVKGAVAAARYAGYVQIAGTLPRE